MIDEETAGWPQAVRALAAVRGGLVVRFEEEAEEHDAEAGEGSVEEEEDSPEVVQPDGLLETSQVGY